MQEPGGAAVLRTDAVLTAAVRCPLIIAQVQGEGHSEDAFERHREPNVCDS